MNLKQQQQQHRKWDLVHCGARRLMRTLLTGIFNISSDWDFVHYFFFYFKIKPFKFSFEHRKKERKKRRRSKNWNPNEIRERAEITN